MKKLFVLFVLFSVSVGTVLAKNPDSKPRVIVMTDGEIDDHSSMIRFLLYTCDVDVLAIIETNSIFQRQGHSDKDWYKKQLEAYEQVYPNLVKHNTNYPTTEKLRKISFMGDENEDHLRGLREKRWDLIPGGKITFTPENWPDTPGSDKIVEIWYQDGAGNYIEQKHPDVTMIYCGLSAYAQNIPPDIQAKADAEKVEAERLSNEAWENGLPVIKEEAQQGKPYVPWASK